VVPPWHAPREQGSEARRIRVDERFEDPTAIDSNPGYRAVGYPHNPEAIQESQQETGLPLGIGIRRYFREDLKEN
jgi:hypothetical protein